MVLEVRTCKTIVKIDGGTPWLVAGAACGPQARTGPNGTVHIGRADVHRSHRPMFTRGLWWCYDCGRMAQAAAQKGVVRGLANPCSEPPAGSRWHRSRLRKGLLPQGLERWPLLDEGAMALPPGVTLGPCRRLAGKTNILAKPTRAASYEKELGNVRIMACAWALDKQVGGGEPRGVDGHAATSGLRGKVSAGARASRPGPVPGLAPFAWVGHHARLPLESPRSN